MHKTARGQPGHGRADSETQMFRALQNFLLSDTVLYMLDLPIEKTLNAELAEIGGKNESSS